MPSSSECPNFRLTYVIDYTQSEQSLSIVRIIDGVTLYDARVVKLTRLRALRERKVLTQQELAEKAGITRATLSRLEAGAENPYSFSLREVRAPPGLGAPVLMGAQRGQ